MRAIRVVLQLLAVSVGVFPVTATAQSADQRAAVLAVVDSALAAVNAGDMEAMASLMIPEAFAMPTLDSTRRSVTTREQVRAQQFSGVIERGFDPTVHIAGAIAVVWLPYDLYLNGEWSHCGVDAFTLVQVDSEWKIAVLAWTIEQPPACAKHPDGPPGG